MEFKNKLKEMLRTDPTNEESVIRAMIDNDDIDFEGMLDLMSELELRTYDYIYSDDALREFISECVLNNYIIADYLKVVELNGTDYYYADPSNGMQMPEPIRGKSDILAFI